jgi:hypothetical protein
MEVLSAGRREKILIAAAIRISDKNHFSLTFSNLQKMNVLQSTSKKIKKKDKIFLA